MRVYLSGPMTGVDDFNREAFRQAAEVLRMQTFDVVNPHELDHADPGMPHEFYMQRDLAILLDGSVGAVVVLPGWENSKGAVAEVICAQAVGIQVWTMDPFCEDLEVTVVNEAIRALAKPPVPRPTADETVLEAASRLTTRDRQDDYGHPIDDFGKTVGMWNALFKRKLRSPLDERDFASAMICVKLSRLEATPDHRDSLVDVAGYARTRELIQEAMDDRAKEPSDGTS